MSLAIVTPSYAPDYENFARLHESVLRHAPEDVTHHVLVPPPDLRLFSQLASDRLQVHSQFDVLPRSFVSTSRLSRLARLPRRFDVAAVNLARPWPPVRGWILQQLVKLAFVASREEDVALIIDSDVLIVRDLDESMFRDGDRVRLYRSPGAVHAGMPQHIRWRTNAARLIGTPTPDPDAADYIASFLTWSPATVRALLGRVETVTGRPWAGVLASELALSECLLYGEYVAAFGTDSEQSFTSAETRCLSHWDPAPLDRAGADAFVHRLAAEHLAIHVQSTSATDRAVLDRLADAAETAAGRT
ncbi:DUF6492 family protein [Agromyces sp. Leaf222]|uniref:DUF6492 family protein n=1 Tax=Agromyces sp. Leaf222 TaxID=1735688 RepID=UPI0006F4F3C2|nr:DUF6492 family protein [Agromyces sp. Leaf222]KQM81443.1 hypothetical protein ASE68_16925 [Agromyces sp. Leaf222]